MTLPRRSARRHAERAAIAVAALSLGPILSDAHEEHAFEHHHRGDGLEPDTQEAMTSADEIRSLERRLLEADHVRFSCTLETTGAIESSFEGDVLLGPEGRARFDLSGTFAGADMDLVMVSDGERLVASAGENAYEGETPGDLREAIVLGLVRMGVMHNVARLTVAAPPDHADGGVAEWLTIHEPAYLRAGSIAGKPARAIGFGVVVDGEPGGTATLWTHALTGIPLERWQSVPFGDQEMRVIERYRRFEIDPEDPGPDAFAIPG